jgi:hypothetical protein
LTGALRVVYLQEIEGKVMTDSQIQQLRYLHAERKHATGIYHDCLRRNAPDAERHAAEAACTATMEALKAFTASLA